MCRAYSADNAVNDQYEQIMNAAISWIGLLEQNLNDMGKIIPCSYSIVCVDNDGRT